MPTVVKILEILQGTESNTLNVLKQIYIKAYLSVVSNNFATITSKHSDKQYVVGSWFSSGTSAASKAASARLLNA